MYAPGFYDYAGGELCFYNGIYSDDYGPEGCLLLSGHRAVRAPLPLRPWPRLVTIQRKPCALEKGRWRGFGHHTLPECTRDRLRRREASLLEGKVAQGRGTSGGQRCVLRHHGRDPNLSKEVPKGGQGRGPPDCALVRRSIGADLELAGLKDMLKGMRREIGVPPKRVRYGVQTQDLAQAMAAAAGRRAALCCGCCWCDRSGATEVWRLSPWA
jgi:hypothetical protein